MGQEEENDESDSEIRISPKSKISTESTNEKKKSSNEGLKIKRNLKGSEEVLRAKFAQFMTRKTKPIPYWKCKCSKVFVNEVDALQHISQPQCKITSKRKQKEYQCYVCDQVFPSKKVLEQHARKEHLEPATCRRCPAIEFKTKASLNRHIKTVHGDKTFSCKVCKKEFKREDSSNRHEETVHYQTRKKWKENSCRKL